MSLKKALRNVGNETATENGAVAYKSTLNNVLDFYYHAAAKRKQPDEVVSLFERALEEDLVLASKALFYLRDIRGGQGERDTFRACLRWLESHKNPIFNKLVVLVAEYGRWDDILEFYYNPVVIELVKSQIAADLRAKKKTSLLAKWLPSAVTSSKSTVDLAYKWMNVLGQSPRDYRKMLSALRKKLTLVETQMSSNEWGAVEYPHVPSKANSLYRKAFSRHDGERYSQFIQDAKSGKVKINSATLYPYDIINLVRYGDDDTAEALWKQLPNYAETTKNALVVCDVSGSMDSELSHNSQVTCMDVSTSLAIYIAERNVGQLHNMFMTFTDIPKLIELRDSWTLYRKLDETKSHVGYNTNVFAVFETLVKQYKRAKLPKEEQAEVIYIISDMQFDSVGGFSVFEKAKKLMAANGFDMPKLVFWNVQSRNTNTPVLFDNRGVYLVSGCSPSIFKNTINAKAVTPEDLMKEVLNKERYDAVEKALMQ